MLELVKFLKKSIIYYSKLSVSELTFLQKFSCGDVVEKRIFTSSNIIVLVFKISNFIRRFHFNEEIISVQSYIGK